MDMRAKKKGLKRVREGSEEIDGERLGAERRWKCSLILLSAVHQHVQQTFNFARGSKWASDTAEIEEHD